MYSSVEEYFRWFFKNYNEFVIGHLDYTGDYWPRVKNNTLPNIDLANVIEVNLKHRVKPTDSAVFLASLALMVGRMTGKVPNPG